MTLNEPFRADTCYFLQIIDILSIVREQLVVVFEQADKGMCRRADAALC